MYFGWRRGGGGGVVQRAKYLSSTRAARILPGISKLPPYLDRISYRNPGFHDSDVTLFQYDNNTPLTFFESLQANPDAHAAFDKFMSNSTKIERSGENLGFASIYDFEGQLAPLVQSDEDVVLVDVGGGLGHVLAEVKRHLPGLRGKMILQDLPETVQRAELPEGIEKMGYNFFEGEQPVRGM
jgi:hypothetical protein